MTRAEQLAVIDRATTALVADTDALARRLRQVMRTDREVYATRQAEIPARRYGG